MIIEAVTVSIWLFSSFVSAALFSELYVFEDAPSANKPLILDISINNSDTSLLVYNFWDTDNTSLPVLSSERNAVPSINVCTSGAIEKGLCTTLGQFIVDLNDAKTITYHGEVLNEYVPKGLSKQYEVYKSGVYCLIAHQKSELVKGVEIKQIHTHGHLSLEKYQKYKALVSSKISLDLIILALFGLFIYNRIFFGINIWKSIPHSFVRDYAILTSLNITVPIYFLWFENSTGTTLSKYWKILLVPSKVFHSAMFLKIFYSVSIGSPTFSRISGDYSKLVKLQMVIFIIAGLFKSLSEILEIELSFLDLPLYGSVLDSSSWWYSFKLIIRASGKLIKPQTEKSVTNPFNIHKLWMFRSATIIALVVTKFTPVLYVIYGLIYGYFGEEAFSIKVNEFFSLGNLVWGKSPMYHFGLFFPTFVCLICLTIWGTTFSFTALEPNYDSMTWLELAVDRKFTRVPVEEVTTEKTMNDSLV